MTKKYFGTDGIRGKVNQTKINGEMFFKFGLAAGTYLKTKKNQNKQLLLQKIQDSQDIHLSPHWCLDWPQPECMSTRLGLCQQMD